MNLERNSLIFKKLGTILDGLLLGSVEHLRGSFGTFAMQLPLVIFFGEVVIILGRICWFGFGFLENATAMASADPQTQPKETTL